MNYLVENMRRRNFTVFLILIHILLMFDNVILSNKGIEVKASDYTLNAEAGNEITIEVGNIIFNSIPIVTTDVLNVINLLSLDIETPIGEFNGGILIENEITDINESDISFQKTVTFDYVSGPDSKGIFSETQSLDEFSITNTVMTSNETLIEENVDKLSITDYTMGEGEIEFTNETIIDDINYLIVSTYHIETGWLTDLYIVMENNTDDSVFFYVEFSTLDMTSKNDISRGNIIVPVNQEYFSTGLEVGDTILLNLTEYVPEEIFLELPIGLNVELKIIGITDAVITYNATFIFPNGTKYYISSPYDCKRDEIEIKDFITTTNTTLLNNSGIYPSFNITYSEGLISFLQILKDEEYDFHSIYEFTYSTETGFIEKYNETRANYNRTEIYYRQVYVAINPTNTTDSLTMPETTTTVPETTSNIPKTTNQTTVTLITTTNQITTTRATSSFDSLTLITLLFIIIIIRKRRK